MAEFVHVKKFGNYVLGEIIKSGDLQGRQIYTLIIKKIFNGDSYKIGQILSISEHELKYYKTEIKYM